MSSTTRTGGSSVSTSRTSTTRRVRLALSGIVSPDLQFGTAFVSVGGSAGKPSLVSSLDRNAIRSLLYLTVVAAFVLIPGQGDDALGIELLVGGVVGAVVTGVPLLRMTSGLRLTLGFRARVVAATVAIALNLAAGASLIARRGGGLYLLIAALLLALVTDVSGAWALLVGLTTDDLDVSVEDERQNDRRPKREGN
jgi:hypothetical protein